LYFLSAAEAYVSVSNNKLGEVASVIKRKDAAVRTAVKTQLGHHDNEVRRIDGWQFV